MAKKDQILKSAISVFAVNGFAEATVSQIANGAGLAGSGLYKHFSGKEEILFTIIENFLVKSGTTLKEHLQGICGAENKLRKAIWFHCKQYSGNRDVIKIVLESRSYPRFYRSTAYTALKEYASVFSQILREGIDEGLFGELTSEHILRDMVLGAVDHIAIYWIVRESGNSLEQAETLHQMVMDAVTPPADKDARLSKKERTRNRIINEAMALLADKGFNDTSMLEIAKAANVAEGTVYEHFGNKENLLIAIPQKKLSELYDDISGEALEKKIAAVITDIFQFYHDEKSYTKILVLMLRTNKRFHQSDGSTIIDRLFDLIKETIIKGQVEKLFKPDLNLELCRHLLFGTIDHIIIPWIIFDRNYDFQKIGNEVARLFINAIRVKETAL